MEVKTLESLCLKITDGAHHSPKEFQGGIPMFSVKDMTDHGFDKSSVKTISKEDYKKLKGSGCEPKDNDVLIAKDGSVMKHVFRYKHYEDCALLSSIAILRPNMEIIDPDYLVYSILNPKVKGNIINNDVSGSGVPRIVLKDFKKIEIKVPEIRIQKASSKILNQINSKIELNNKMNQTHEEIAKTLFKSWFIDFDPVRAKAEGRPTGLSKEISDLFPDSFEDSELGKIPKSWQITNLDALTSKFTTGLNPRKNFVLGSGENFYVTIKNLGDFDVVLDEKCDKVDNDAIKKINSRSDLKKDDILFSGIGTIGKVAYVFSEPKNWNISESVFSLRANSEITYPSFLYQLLKSYPLQGYVDALASGSVQRGIRMGSLKEYKFSLSNFEVQKKFNEIISPLIEKISINLKETRNLIFIRDILLPKLISGELRIPDAEKLVEEIGI